MQCHSLQHLLLEILHLRNFPLYLQLLAVHSTRVKVILFFSDSFSKWGSAQFASIVECSQVFYQNLVWATVAANFKCIVGGEDTHPLYRATVLGEATAITSLLSAKLATEISYSPIMVARNNKYVAATGA